MTPKIPLVDLYAQYLTIKSDIDSAIAAVIEKSAFIRGEYVDRFEEEFCRAVGTRHCVSCANGTDSLFIGMHALGVQRGDEVIVPAHSWISTSETVSLTGAKPVFCDTEDEFFTIDPRKVEEKITEHTVGIIPVHLYGHAADMDPIMEISRKHRLWVIEDCAQAHLATYKGQMVGTFGAAASYSFYPGKNLGAMGDAGAIVTNDASLAERMTMFARHGGLTKGDHRIEGINSRLDGLQAAILSVKLAHLKKWTAERQRCADRYLSLLSSISGLVVPRVRRDCSHVWHLFVIRVEDRDGLVRHLSGYGIQTAINYPVALPFLPAYARLMAKPEHFPNAFFNQSRVLSIPIFPELSDGSVSRIAAAIGGFFGT